MAEKTKSSVLDSLEIVKSRGSVTLIDEEYFHLADAAAAEVRRLCSNLSLWNTQSDNNGVSIFERKSELPHASQPMLLAIVDLPCTIQKLEKLVSPWEEYLLQWDSMLEGVEIVASWPDKEVYLVHHMVKKMMPMSARDSIDIVKVLRSENAIVLGSTSTVHADHPPSENYMRTHHYIGGYMLRPSDADPSHTKFHLLFHADLNLPGPRLIASLVQKVKNLMGEIQKMESQEENLSIDEVGAKLQLNPDVIQWLKTHNFDAEDPVLFFFFQEPFFYYPPATRNNYIQQMDHIFTTHGGIYRADNVYYFPAMANLYAVRLALRRQLPFLFNSDLDEFYRLPNDPQLYQYSNNPVITSSVLTSLVGNQCTLNPFQVFRL